MVREINIVQIARKKTLGEKLVFVEISPLEEYEKLQIAGAINLPLEKLRQLAPQYLPNRGAEIMVYGPGCDSPAAWVAARALSEMGYGNIYVYPGGKEEWTRLGYDIESVHYPPPPPPMVAGPPARVVKPAA